MTREDLELEVEDARTCASIIRLLASDEVSGSHNQRKSFYAYLGDRLDAHFEVIQREIEDLPPEPEPPPMPPLTEREVEGNAEITERLRELADRCRQRNLDRAVELAQEAAEGRGPLVAHFGELGRRFAAETTTGAAE